MSGNNLPNNASFPRSNSPMNNNPQEIQMNFGQAPMQSPQKEKKKGKAKGCFLAVIIVMVITFVSFIFWVFLSPPDDSVEAQTTDNNFSETVKSEPKDILISDNDYFSARFVKATSVPDIDDCFYIYINIENKSSAECIYILEDVYIDDTAANFSGSGLPQKALAGKKLNGVFCIFSEQKIEDASKLEFKVVCHDSNYNEITSSDMVTLKLK